MVIMNKKVKELYKHLEEMLGEWNAGLILAIACDAFDNFVEGSEDGRDLRTIEFKFNDFFSTKYDFKKGEFVK